MKALIFFALALGASNAFACWSCEGTKEECNARIEQSRNSTVEQLAKNGAASCQGKPEGILPEHFGISTAGSFATVCDGKGGGCLHWVADDLGQPRDKYYPLGGAGTCETARATYEENKNKPLVAQDLSKEDLEYVDEKGNRVVLLDEDVAAGRKQNSAPASVEIGIPLSQAAKQE